MKLGFRQGDLFANDFEALFRFAAEVSAESVELDWIQMDQVPRIKKLSNSSGIAISSLGAMTHSLLGPDMERARIDREKTAHAIDVAHRLEVPCVSLFAGNDPSRTLEENVRTFTEVFGPLADKAASSGVTLVFENCPSLGGRPLVSKNFAHCPHAWSAMFAALPSPAIGLELDTAHLPWLGIDAIRCVRDFAPRLRHVHLKDIHIDEEKLYQFGRWSGRAYVGHCTPGEGQIDFAAFVAILREVGYSGSLTLDLKPVTEPAVRAGMKHMHGIMRKTA